MDFLERLFDFSPDGGDGSIEILLIIAALLIGTSIWISRRTQTEHRWGRKNGSSER